MRCHKVICLLFLYQPQKPNQDPTLVSVIALNSQGNIYVGISRIYLPYDFHIQVFDAQGNFLYKWGSSCNLESGKSCQDPDGSGPLELGDGQFGFITGIAIDNNDNIYIADGLSESNCRIQVFNSEGKFLRKWGNCSSNLEDVGKFYYPGGDWCSINGIDIDAKGNIYAIKPSKLGDYSSYVLKFDSQGTFLKEWSVKFCDPTGGIQPISTRGIAIDKKQEFVYITAPISQSGCEEEPLILKFDLDGNLIDRWGFLDKEQHSSKPEAGKLALPYSLTIDDKGNVYVVELFANRVQKFDSNGNWLSLIGCCYPNQPEKLNDPRDIIVTPNGERIYVGNSNTEIPVLAFDLHFIND